MAAFRRILTGLAFLVFAAAAGTVFFAFNMLVNRDVHRTVLHARAQDPQFLPSRAVVDAFGGGFRQLVANADYVRSVQYVGSFLRTAEYKRHLYDLYASVTDLDPYFADAYENGPLLLAFQNQGEPFTVLEQSLFVDQAVRLAQKGVASFCDAAKVEKIAAEPDLVRVWTDPAYSDPCRGHDLIPYRLAYVLFRYQRDAAAAAKWYRVASAHPDAIRASKYMAVLMQGRAGDRATSSLMFLSMAQNQSKPGDHCSTASTSASDALFSAFRSGVPGSPLLARLAAARDALRQEEGACATEFARAVREADFAYLEAADARFFKAKGRHAADAGELEAAGYGKAPAGDVSGQAGLRFFYDPKTGRWDWGSGPK